MAAQVRRAAEVAEDQHRRGRQRAEAQAARHGWLVAAMVRDLEGLVDRGKPALALEAVRTWERAEKRAVQVWFASTRSGASRGRKLAQRLGLPWDSIEGIRAGIDHKRMPMPPPTELEIAAALRDAAEQWRSRPPPDVSALDPPPLDDPPTMDDLDWMLARWMLAR